MAWNEPGGNNKDPWNRKQKGSSEIDALVKQDGINAIAISFLFSYVNGLIRMFL